MARGPFYDPGRYWGRITRQRLGETTNHNPQLILSFVVIGKLNPLDPDGDLLPVQAQYERTVFRVITDNTIDYVLQDLETLGFTGGKWQQFDEGDPECHDLRGKEFAFSCSHEKDQEGNMRERWGVAQTSIGPPVKPLDQTAASKLEAMFGRKLRERCKAKAPATPAPVVPATDKAAFVAESKELAATEGDGVPF